MKFLYASLLVTLLIPASAETITNTMPCGETKVVTKHLMEKFNEAPIILGVASDAANSVMSLWINPQTKSWTILATKSDISCVIGVGNDFTILTKQGNII
jgi:hypothetical protein